MSTFIFQLSALRPQLWQPSDIRDNCTSQTDREDYVYLVGLCSHHIFFRQPLTIQQICLRPWKMRYANAWGFYRETHSKRNCLDRGTLPVLWTQSTWCCEPFSESRLCLLNAQILIICFLQPCPVGAPLGYCGFDFIYLLPYQQPLLLNNTELSWLNMDSVCSPRLIWSSLQSPRIFCAFLFGTYRWCLLIHGGTAWYVSFAF